MELFEWKEKAMVRNKKIGERKYFKTTQKNNKSNRLTTYKTNTEVKEQKQ